MEIWEIERERTELVQHSACSWENSLLECRHHPPVLYISCMIWLHFTPIRRRGRGDLFLFSKTKVYYLPLCLLAEEEVTHGWIRLSVYVYCIMCENMLTVNKGCTLARKCCIDDFRSQMFSVVFPLLPPPLPLRNFWVLPFLSLLLTNTVSPVRACLIIWWESFLGTKKEDDRGPLSIQFSLVRADFYWSTLVQTHLPLHISSTQLKEMWGINTLIKVAAYTELYRTLALLFTTLQRQNAENLKQIFPEKEYRGLLSPSIHIHVSVSELYIPTMGLPVRLEEICRLILGIYKSLKDTWMWKLGLRPRYSQKRNI